MCEKCGSRLQAQFHASLEKKLANRYGPLHAEYQLHSPRLDFALPQRKIGIELDSGSWHATPEQVEWDETRESFFRRRGWHIIRVSGADAYKDRETAVNITAAMIRQYLVGRAMEAQHPDAIDLPKKLFTRAKRLIFLTPEERQLEAMFAGKGSISETGETNQHTSTSVVNEETPAIAAAPSVPAQPKKVVTINRQKGYTRVTPQRLFTAQIDGEKTRVSTLHQQIYQYLAHHGEATTAELADALQKPEGTIRTVIGRFEWAGCFASEKRGRHNYYSLVGPFPTQETAA